MYKFSFTYPKSVFTAIRNLPKKTQREFEKGLRKTVQPAIQKHADDLLGEEPGAVVHPFGFATERSRRAYFATNGFGQGIPYRRRGAVSSAWVALVNSRGVRIYNKNLKSKFVYGPRQVPGHRRTGWGKDFDVAFVLLQEETEREVVNEWSAAFLRALEQ